MQFPLLLISLLPLAFAQYGSPSSDTTSSSSKPASTPTTSASSSVHTITVGNGTLAFSPNTVTAAAGDSLEFHFFAPLHSVSQGNFSSPCSPLSSSSFFSGAITTSSGENTNVFTVIVNDTNPIWFYCGVPGHCEAGMAGVVNAPADGSETLSQYQSAASSGKTTTNAQAQGGILGPPQVASTSSTPSTSTSATPSSSSKPSAGTHARDDVKWIYVVLVCLFSVGMGALMV